MTPRINLPLVGATVSGRWPLSLMKGIDRHALDTRSIRGDLQSCETTEFVEKDCESHRTTIGSPRALSVERDQFADRNAGRRFVIGG